MGCTGSTDKVTKLEKKAGFKFEKKPYKGEEAQSYKNLIEGMGEMMDMPLDQVEEFSMWTEENIQEKRDEMKSFGDYAYEMDKDTFDKAKE